MLTFVDNISSCKTASATIQTPSNYVSLQLDDHNDGIICYTKDPAQDTRKIAYVSYLHISSISAH